MNLKLPILDTKFWLVWKGLGVCSAGAPSGEAVVAVMISFHHFKLGGFGLLEGRRIIASKVEEYGMTVGAGIVFVVKCQYLRKVSGKSSWIDSSQSLQWAGWCDEW